VTLARETVSDAGPDKRRNSEHRRCAGRPPSEPPPFFELSAVPTLARYGADDHVIRRSFPQKRLDICCRKAGERLDIGSREAEERLDIW